MCDIRGFEQTIAEERKGELLRIAEDTWALFNQVLINTLDDPTAMVNEAAFDIFCYLYKEAYGLAGLGEYEG
jgi:hypothetical protein